ncbi:hypothetical protein TWF730_001819 [Orbilia blumenaviensis]|uniref:AAA+ ATPase domain-containing protein n=1 Tax=Orbilia blumenaviensis TaxID=1796055 RepID=A0AAV9UCV4_9PEZI
MSLIEAQPPATAVIEPIKKGDGEGLPVDVCEYCGSKPALLRQHDSEVTLVEGLLPQSANGSGSAGKEPPPPPPPPLLEGDAKTDRKRAAADSDSEKKEHAPEVIQEVKITRVPPEKWRQVKKERKIDPHQSVLLVSSKANFKVNLRKKRAEALKAGAAEKKTADPVTKESGQLDVPYRLAINSPYLLNAIGQCTGANITEDRNVLVRPFKYLVWYEAEIRQFFKDLELAYEQAEAEDQADLRHDSPKIGVRDDDNTAAAITDDGESAKKTETAREAVDRAKRERDEFRCLLEFMDRDMADIFDIKRQISDKTLKGIAFEHLWQLFRPGNIAYHFNTQDDGSRYQAYRILHVTGGRVCFDSGKKSSFNAVKDRTWESESETEERCRDIIGSSGHEVTSFLIDCFYFESDGLRIGPRSKRFVVPRYKGTRPINLLPLYPSFLHPDNQRIQAILLARGKQFIEAAGGTHKKYEGNTIRESNITTKSYNNFMIDDAQVHSEVIVDQASGVEHFKNKLYGFKSRLGGGILFSPTLSDTREIFDPLPNKEDNNWVTDVFDDSKFETDCWSDFLESTELLTFQFPGRHSSSDECLILLPPRLYGYSLLDHKWFALDVSRLSEIPPRSLTANFKDLVLPDGHALLLQALIKHHVRQPKQSPNDPNEIAEGFSMDVVEGKGKGLIILLHGVPGVGKTSTAECLAAELKRPLLPITCGDLGTTAAVAEGKLETFCALAHKWRCVLLLDEADVFLAKREKGDIDRNSLVSVFLRVLEYYSGVIILTTNRVGEFDEAFRSRVHISLYYPKLGQASTKEIWEKNISRLKASGMDIDIEEDKIRSFVDKHWESNKHNPSRQWNGRQIKNAFQTAIALANWDFYNGQRSAGLKRPLIKAAHFKRVARTYEGVNERGVVPTITRNI